MKRISILFLCLGLISVACLSTSSAVITAEEMITPSVTLTTLTKMLGATVRVESTSMSSPRTCAMIIADEAVNMRIKAVAADHVLTWLKNGELVQVMERTTAEWWKVKRGDDIGFVRSIYLAEVECE